MPTPRNLPVPGCGIVRGGQQSIDNFAAKHGLEQSNDATCGLISSSHGIGEVVVAPRAPCRPHLAAMVIMLATGCRRGRDQPPYGADVCRGRIARSTLDPRIHTGQHDDYATCRLPLRRLLGVWGGGYGVVCSSRDSWCPFSDPFTLRSARQRPPGVGRHRIPGNCTSNFVQVILKHFLGNDFH